MSLPSMRRLVKASRHGLRTGGTIYVGTLPINRGPRCGQQSLPAIPTGGRVAYLECATGNELPTEPAPHTTADSWKTACLILQKRGLHFAQYGAHGFEIFHRDIRRGDVLNL